MLKVAKDMVAKDMAAKDMAGTSVWLNHDERRRAKGQLIGRIRGRGEARRSVERCADPKAPS
jgi:hypothetical protein